MVEDLHVLTLKNLEKVKVEMSKLSVTDDYWSPGRGQNGRLLDLGIIRRSLAPCCCYKKGPQTWCLKSHQFILSEA